MGESRTSKSIKNSIVALAFYFVGLALQFISRKIFLDYLGTEVLGLNTTATNLLQFLNIAELGISSAISFSLYKPIYNNDTDTINEIVSLQGWLYRNIAFIIIAGAMILMCFFPWIFSKTPLPLWYSYASFGVLLFSSLLGYFVNYKQIVLTANQQDYKIQYSYQSVMILKRIAQIVALSSLENSYVWWLIIESIFAIIGAASLEVMTRISCPYLKPDLSKGKILQKKYPEVGTKIKQVFFHKIGTFALTQTSPLIIFAYASLSYVTLYGNYMMIIAGVTSLMTAMFGSMNAGVGNLVAEGNDERSFSVFRELFSIRFIFVCTICYGVYVLTPDFIALWIGKEYILPNTTLAIMVLLLFVNLSRSTVDAFIGAYGLYDDIWAPVVESVINIGLSILLGYFWGLNGILLGVLISLLLVIVLWKPYWLFRRGFKIKTHKYFIFYLSHIAIGFAVWFVSSVICDLLPLNSGGDFMSLAITAFTRCLLYMFLITLIIVIIDKNVRNRLFALCTTFRKKLSIF